MEGPLNLTRREFSQIMVAAWLSRLPKPDEMLGLPIYKPNPDSFWPAGQLSPEQASNLYQVSQRYLAPDMTTAIAVAKQIGEQDPSNICGPLAARQLIDAGLLKGIDSHQFWLLNPRINNNVERVFLANGYSCSFENQSNRNFNFDKYPLRVGDFLYLYGAGDHMEVVNRVDAQGQAYTVSNVFKGRRNYTIEEVAVRDFAKLPYGQNGFDVWRKLENVSSLEKLQGEIRGQLNFSDGRWQVLIKELGQDPLLAFNETEQVHPASAIKVVIAMLFAKFLEQPNVDRQRYLRDYDSSLRLMLVNSDEGATAKLTELVSNKLNYLQTLQEWGLTQTLISPRRSTALDLVKALEGLYQGNWLNGEDRDRILNYMATYTAGDDGRLGLIGKNPNFKVYNKRASLTGPLVVGDIALVATPGKVYSLALLGHQGDGKRGKATYESLEQALNLASQKLSDYFAQNS